MQQKLFLVYVGGDAPGANIELHDVRFVVGNSIEDTYPALKQQWFGNRGSVHMDSYVHVHHVDGYRIQLAKAPSLEKKKLYFVNFGGYFPGKLAEYHDFTIVVASSAEEARALAKPKVLAAGLAGSGALASGVGYAIWYTALPALKATSAATV
ncbi:DUF1543 domain-containing protein, partial [Aliidiomarina sp.]|uniref:DUF1543 domain-containing protein n=1 Tax=Aliidiomarina sp. TaxID=1872439 RepID=UPI003A4DD615